MEIALVKTNYSQLVLAVAILKRYVELVVLQVLKDIWRQLF